MQQSDRQTGCCLPALLSCLATLILLAGCGSVRATSEGMAAGSYDVTRQHPYSVEVVTSGAEAASADQLALISDTVLAQAIEEAIVDSGVFREVSPAPPADYQLSVHLFSLENPTAGFTASTNMEAGWTLKRLADDRMIWRESIASVGSATAFGGRDRLRLVTEAAARENIQEGIQRLSELDL